MDDCVCEGIGIAPTGERETRSAVGACRTNKRILPWSQPRQIAGRLSWPPLPLVLARTAVADSYSTQPPAQDISVSDSAHFWVSQRIGTKGKYRRAVIE